MTSRPDSSTIFFPARFTTFFEYFGPSMPSRSPSIEICDSLPSAGPESSQDSAAMARRLLRGLEPVDNRDCGTKRDSESRLVVRLKMGGHQFGDMSKKTGLTPPQAARLSCSHLRPRAFQCHLRSNSASVIRKVKRSIQKDHGLEQDEVYRRRSSRCLVALLEWSVPAPDCRRVRDKCSRGQSRAEGEDPLGKQADRGFEAFRVS